MRGQRLKDVTMVKFQMGLLSQLDGLGWPDQQLPTMGLLSQGGGIRNASPGTGMLIHHFSPDGSPPPDLSNPLAAFDPSAASAGSMLNQGDGTAPQPSATPAMGLLAQQDGNSQSPFGSAVGMRAQQPQEPSQIDLRPDGSPTQSSDLPAPGAANAGPAPLPQAGPMAMFAQPQNQLPQSSLAPADDGEENTPTPAKPTGGILGAQQPQQPQPQQGPAGQPMQLQGATAPQQPEQGGFMNGVGKFVDKLGNIYGQGGPGDALINLGAGLASGKPWGQGVLDASKATATQKAVQAQTDIVSQKQAGQNQTAQFLSSKMKIPYEQALGMVQSGNASQLIAQASQSPEQYQTFDKDGDTYQRNNRTGQVSLVTKGSEDFKPLTDPAERAMYGIKPTDTGIYQKDSRGKVMAIGTPQNNTIVNSTVNPILKGMGEQFTSQAEDARAAAEGIRSIHSARTQLDSDGGIVAGAFANNRLAIEKVGNLLGLKDADKITNTETFLTQIKPQVIEMLKATGTNPSNADRDFSAAMSGGNIGLAEQTIRRTLDFNEARARQKIDRFNQTSDQMISAQPDLKQMAPMMRVQAPDQYQAPAKTSAPSQNSPKRFKYDATGNLVAQ
jgi:hypothetical protein